VGLSRLKQPSKETTDDPVREGQEPLAVEGQCPETTDDPVREGQEPSLSRIIRKSNRDADLDSLADNIAAHGLCRISWEKAGTVKAGGRRLRALQRLIETNRLAADHEVQVLVLEDDAGSAEASLAENFIASR
jgi:hypothetical protein